MRFYYVSFVFSHSRRIPSPRRPFLSVPATIARNRFTRRRLRRNGTVQKIRFWGAPYSALHDAVRINRFLAFKSPTMTGRFDCGVEIRLPVYRFVSLILYSDFHTRIPSGRHSSPHVDSSNSNVKLSAIEHFGQTYCTPDGCR